MIASASVIIKPFYNVLKLTMQSPFSGQPGHAQLGTKYFITGKSFSIQQTTGPVIALCVFCVFLFNTAWLLYYCEHSEVDLMGLKPNL